MANIFPFGSAPDLAKLGYESISLANGEKSLLVYGTNKEVLQAFRGQTDVVLCTGPALAERPGAYEFYVMRKTSSPASAPADDIAADDIRLASEDLTRALNDVVASYDLTDEMLQAALKSALAVTKKTTRQ